MINKPISTNHILQSVRYEIRGELAARAGELFWLMPYPQATARRCLDKVSD